MEFKTYAIREDVEAIKEAVPDTVLDAKTELVAIPNRYVKISRVEMTPAVPKHRYVEISRVRQQRSVNKHSASVRRVYAYLVFLGITHTF